MNDRGTTSDPGENALSHALKRMPDRPAPPTLMPRVLEAVAARERGPWFVRAWRQAPRRQQALAMMAVSAVFMLPLAWFVAALLPREWLAGAGACQTVADALHTATSAFCDNCVNIALTVAAVFVLALYLTCLGLGTAAYQIMRRH